MGGHVGLVVHRSEVSMRAVHIVAYAEEDAGICEVIMGHYVALKCQHDLLDNSSQF